MSNKGVKFESTKRLGKVLISDLETLKCFFDAGFYDYEEDKWYEFEISSRKNDLYSLVKFYREGSFDYLCGFNYVAFDSQVLEFINREHEKWIDFSPLEICLEIYKFVQEMINSQRFSNFVPYREKFFKRKVIDVFTIFGLSNEARRSSWTLV